MRFRRLLSASVPPVSVLIGSYGSPQVDLSELWPKDVKEAKLAVGALPEEKAAQPLFA